MPVGCGDDEGPVTVAVVDLRAQADLRTQDQPPTVHLFATEADAHAFMDAQPDRWQYDDITDFVVATIVDHREP